MAYVFNTDLLLGEKDRTAAGCEYPDVYFALDNQTARETFAPHDERANVMKTRSRRWGVFAVFLATGALLLAGGEMLYHDLPKNQLRLIAALGGIAGIVSVVIGVFGIMYRDRKNRWLSDRLTTERIRQFHFQSYVMGASDILAGAKDEARKQEFLKSRAAEFEQFRTGYLEHIDDRLHELVHTEDTGEGAIITSVSHEIDPTDPHLQQYFDAYVNLRFNRQIGYCDLVLRENQGFWKHAPKRQEKILGTIALGCVLGILVLHGLVFVGAVANIAWMKGPLVHVAAIWAAIIALSARTFEEGFQPEREIERMRQYRLSLKRIYDRFVAAEDEIEEKLDAMQELEKLTYQEMVLFLKSNYEAQFVM